MNVTQTTRLCRAIAALAPAQKFDDETPAIWSVVLAGVRYEDAREAVVAIAQRQAFIAPADVIAEVRRIRRNRLASADRMLPDVDPDDVPAWLAARRGQLAALADGDLEAPPVLDAPQDARLTRALPHVFRRPEAAPRLEVERQRQLTAVRAMPDQRAGTREHAEEAS